ncbi:hypothetical protein, partial [Salmonella enterica]|uniref:hypothetical protein n=1 Tax=Salmonella enterica TaxID=28901 RepID=UPI003CE867BA
VGGGAQAQTQAQAQAQTPKPENLYVIIYRPGPKWDPSRTMAQQLGPHGRYIQGLLDDGRLVAGGAMPAINGGLAIFREASETA